MKKHNLQNIIERDIVRDGLNTVLVDFYNALWEVQKHCEIMDKKTFKKVCKKLDKVIFLT